MHYREGFACLAVPFFYKTVHKIHHQSVNPDAFSGHSMHPVEHLLFYSSLALCMLIPMPYWVFRLMKNVVLLTPLAEHMGALTGHRHYLHHTHFSFNYGEGLRIAPLQRACIPRSRPRLTSLTRLACLFLTTGSSLLFDVLLGTSFDDLPEAKRSRLTHTAKRQAELAGASNSRRRSNIETSECTSRTCEHVCHEPLRK